VWRRTALAGLLALAPACGAPKATGEVVRFTVPQGASLRQVADTLAARGLVSSKLGFRILARVTRGDRRIRTGIYEVPLGTSAGEILAILRTGRVATARITVPEGLTVAELAELVGERHGLDSALVRQAAASAELRDRLGLTRPDLEGFLLPETYTLPIPVSEEALVEAMVAAFERRWTPAWQARADSLGLTRLEVVTLASIVEGEARHDDERAVIAGVYTNRLRRGMPLQADPTVQYAIQLATGRRKPRLYFKDYAFRSPYNTYLSTGLPPGPVNSPGAKSIEAALYPAPVPFLYFVALPDGHHRFSRTLAEHNRAIREIRGR
jgi:UPF0755 protein